ncbi:glucose-1-phosphate thymidylyltransferase [Dactylosporangium sp. NPDC051485]|uniref:glucose-1-phosphate thymidylyltransferase n=1 Tax=Dactylosporangium sp. NPDC051485 TaxID=3154846 RepID=UPI0034277770
MKALILSGGSGTRMRPLSYAIPKQLLPVANRPVLAHVLDNVRALGVTDVGVVVGDRGPEIADALGDGAAHGLRLTYIRQDQPLGLAHAVLLARDFLAGDDFVLYLGDNVLPDGILDAGRRFGADRPAAHLLVQKVVDPRRFGVAELSPDDTVRRLVEKPAEPRSDLALIGVYFFTAAIHPAVRAIRPGRRGELELTDAIQWLIDAGAPVRATRYDGYWQDVGEVDDLLECNRRMLDQLTARTAGRLDRTSEVVGPVVIEPGADIRRSRIVGPAVIGAGTQILDSELGPYVSIGADCRVTRSRLSGSMLLDGASVSDVRGLADSLIGRCATVGSSESGIDGHRLVVGDRARIEIAT